MTFEVTVYPDPASVRVHEKSGFEKVAHFRENGLKFDRWIDVGYWQLMLCGGGMPTTKGRTPDTR